MKLGIFLLAENYTNSSYLAMANDLEYGVYAEKLGFDEVWFGEHHFNSFSVIPNPTLMMASLVARTKNIRIGSAAFLAPFYNSVRLSEEISTLDNLSNGRINAGFAKGGFAYDIEQFEKSPESLRQEMFESVEKIDQTLYNYSLLEPKPLQKRIPFFIATFSTIETIEFAAKRGYGLMFSQGATIDECAVAQEVYKKIAGFEPEIVLMRVFCMDDDYKSAYEKALPETDHFIKCMRAVKSRQAQPTFKKENYEALLKQRFSFFDGKSFLDNAILGDDKECIQQIEKIKSKIKNLHLVLKVASSNAMQTRGMLERFSQKVKPNIKG